MRPLRPDDARRVDRYLGELSAALSPLPAAERAEIVREARSHVVERLGRREGDLDVILGDMGPPAEYAGSFLEARGVDPEARADPQPPPTTAGRLAQRGARVAAAVLHGLASLLMVVAFYKLVWPSRVGVWSLPPEDAERVRLHFSVGSDPPPGNDIFGVWLIPLALALAVALVALARLLRGR
jgi:hypothetical protein